ncbi:MAG: HEPN domain-containing protein [Thermoproteales archaeon]|nr:HEPN domain-containing protein [Thermoproteales archaeon]
MFNPLGEVNYGRRAAEKYLEEAEDFLYAGNWRAAVASAQLAAENAAKAIIAVYHLPSWAHDPSNELLSLLPRLPRGVRCEARELAEIASALAPEHARSTYGEPSRGLLPWEIYTRRDAEEAVERAKRAVQLMRYILERLRVELGDAEGAEVR